tara:strand:+ start:894 stop:1058 length:165 start_codon:yes stop_codon:yes gene_type:complete
MKILNEQPIDLEELIKLMPQPPQPNVDLINGVLAVVFFSVPLLTFSTILHQWLI